MKLSHPFLIILLVFTMFYWFSSINAWPFQVIMDWRNKLEVSADKEVNLDQYYIYKLINREGNIPIELEVVAGKHFWYPQIAIWTETLEGEIIETIMVTRATAKGLFSRGRNKENFKNFDSNLSIVPDNLARVDALPYWSHKRGVKHMDGYYSPHSSMPLADGITGATPITNFRMNTSAQITQKKIQIIMEVNVAFDDNEYFSEFDFPTDTIYHSGTGQLGQPSLIYKAVINLDDSKKYYLLDLIGHAHHSASDGRLYKDLSQITTAKDIIERAMIRIN